MTKNRKERPMEDPLDFDRYLSEGKEIEMRFDPFQVSPSSTNDYFLALLKLIETTGVESLSLTSLIDILIEVSLRLKILISSGAYFLDKTNPEIRFYPFPDVLGNPMSVKIHGHREKFQDPELAKYFYSLSKQCVEIKRQIRSYEFLSQKLRGEWNVSLFRHIQSFFSQIDNLKSKVSSIPSLFYRKRRIYRNLRNIENQVKRLERDVKRH